MMATLGVAAFLVIQISVLVRALLRPQREPAARIAWVVVIAVLPGLGVVAYLLFGETSIGRRRVARSNAVITSLPDQDYGANQSPTLSERQAQVFRLGQSINGFHPVGGNTAQLTRDSNDAIDCIVADIDSATRHVHVCFYIWLSDSNGLKVAEALKRAAGRGVTCRAIADGLGSRDFIKSMHWQDMAGSGVKLAVALRIGNPLLRPFRGRIDLRNHRKVVVIDDWITFCGSQNCADPEFRVKPRYAPWVDVLVRFEGPIARQNQYVFASDWMASTGEDITDLLRDPVREASEGFVAQVVATGPTVRASAAPEVFVSLLYAARRRVVITTPYYVPNESLQAALCAAANRGVDTTIVFPARNDSFIVGAASRSYYRDLLVAGVNIFEYRDGLLHAKTFTVDGGLTFIGSANMDRRSFELNYENNVLLVDESLTLELTDRQQSYIARANRITLEDVDRWSASHRLLHNTVAMLGPLL